MDLPLCKKFQIFQLLNIIVNVVYKRFFCVKAVVKLSFWAIWTRKKKSKETWNFWPKLWTNPFLKNANFAIFWYQCSFSLEKLFVYQEHYQTFFFCEFGQKKWRLRNVKLSTKMMHSPTRFLKMEIFWLSNINVL